MKTLTTFKNACAQLLEEIDVLESRNLELLKQVEAHRASATQIEVLMRHKKSTAIKHARQLERARARAAEFRAKMGEYRRDLVALRTIVRHQKRT